MWRSLYIMALFLTTGLASVEDLLRIDLIVQEDTCRRAGGICTVSADCPGGHLTEKTGLCPNQRQEGVECCYGISMKETRCIKHGGVCMSPDKFCNPKLVFKGAEDCPQSYSCCIMTL